MSRTETARLLAKVHANNDAGKHQAATHAAYALIDALADMGVIPPTYKDFT